MTNRANLKRILSVRVSEAAIVNGAGCNPNKCMIKLEVARAIGVPHGYVRVDATGISVTRRRDYREKAFMPKTALHAMYLHDIHKDDLDVKEEPRNILKWIKPFSIKLAFHKTSNVAHHNTNRKAQINAARDKRKAEGRPDKTYDLTSRIAGVAINEGWKRPLKKGTKG